MGDIRPAPRHRVVLLEDVSSQELMDRDLPACPFCGGAVRPAPLRAGLASYVAALVCVQCRCILRARDTFSLDPENVP